MTSPIYQNVINLVVHLSLKRGLGVFMNVTMKKHSTSDNKVLDVAKFTTLTLLISCELVFPITGLKTSSLTNFKLKSTNNIFALYLGNYLATLIFYLVGGSVEHC
jgi:uncharacterized membrane protein